MSYGESSTLIVGHHVCSPPQQRIRRNTAEGVRSLEATDVTGAKTSPIIDGGGVNDGGGRIWKLVCLNMLVCGIEICASAGFTYLPPMMLKSGFPETSMTFVMGIGPFLALIAVPFLGRWSDRCRSRMGRRKPFLIGIALIMTISLILIAHGHKISHFFAPGDAHLQAVLLIFGIILLDFGCHAGFNPCEALVADGMKHSTDEKKTGFTVYSTMISVGGCIGYIITAVDWSSFDFLTSADAVVTSGGHDQIAFSVILVLFVVTVLTTILVAKEVKIDDDHQLYPSTYRNNASSVDPAGMYSSIYIENSRSRTCGTTTVDSSSEDVGYETGSNEYSTEEPTTTSIKSRVIEPSISTPVRSAGDNGCSKAFKIFSFFKLFKMFLMTLRRCYRDWPFLVIRLPRRILSCFSAINSHIRSRLNVPLVLRRLFVADFCSWTALMCHNMFYTDYVGQAIYGGNPNAANDALGSRLYDDGIRMGSCGLLLHSITSILYVNTIQNSLIRACGLQKTYFIGLAIFAISVTLTLMTNNLMLINVLAALSGTGFAVVTTIPNMLVTAYHSDTATFFASDYRNSDQQQHGGRAPVCRTPIELQQQQDNVIEPITRGLASDFSILDSAYFLSQIVLSVSVGTIVDLTRSVSSYIAISAAFGFLACFFSTRVIFPKDFNL